MACADIVRFWTLRNSYITVVTAPGWTWTEDCAGLKSHGPRALASNSTVMVRLVSTWVLKVPGPDLPLTSSSLRLRMLIPSASQIDSYIGTSA